MRLAVIGAGITGVTTAYALARRGHDVTVFERHRYAGMLTSYANGGQFSVSNSEVWTTWPNVLKGMKWMLRKDAPLLIHPSPSLAKYKWIAAFLHNTAKGVYAQNTIETIRLGLRARDLYLQIAADEGLDFDLTRKGILHFYKDEHYFKQALQANAAIYRQAGVKRSVLDVAGVLAIEPRLEADHIVGGIYTPDDANGDIHKFCVGLAAVLVARYNVRFHYEADVADLAALTRDHDGVVICAGVESAALSRSIGDPLNIYPVKGYSITLEGDPDTIPDVSLLDDEAKIVACKLGNRFRVAGTAELAGVNYDIRHDRVQPLVNWVRRNFPGVNTEQITPWAGLRPMTPGMLPVVRRSKDPKVFFNTGHGHLGWTLSAATAELIADEIERSAA